MTVNKLGQHKIPCAWYQNIQDTNRPFILLTAIYDPELYPTYDNYEAIEVSSIKNIPNDYYGDMGVPIGFGFLPKHNPEQFEIVDMLAPYVNGKKKYMRLLIRRKDDN